jgi:hypothetical protein
MKAESKEVTSMPKMLLPAAGHLANSSFDEDFEDLGGELRCPCGGEYFRLFHSGRRPTALQRFFRTFRIDPDGGKTLAIAAKCALCGWTCTLHCDEPDGDGWLLPEENEMKEFIHPRLRDQRLRLAIHYYWEANETGGERAWDVGYLGIYLRGWNDEHPKPLSIFD